MVFKPSRGGYTALLKSPAMAAMISGVAHQVATNVANQGLTASSPGDESGAAITAVVGPPVVVNRVLADVTIEHPAGEAMQAIHGVLTKALAAAGLEMKARKVRR